MAEPPEQELMSGRRLIVTADDYGAMRSIDDGIMKALEEGFVNTVSALVSYSRSVDSIIELKSRYPNVPVGLHVSITSGYPVSDPSLIPSLVDDEGRFYTIDELIPIAGDVNLDDLRIEIIAQLSRFESTGINIDHLSSQHNFLHLYTPFFEVLSDIAREKNLPLRSTVPLSQSNIEYAAAMTTVRGKELAGRLAVKSPFRSMKFRKYGTLSEMQKNQASMSDIDHPDYLIDGVWGTPTPENVLNLISHLPEGTGELVFHLGVYDPADPVPYGIEEEYLLMREFELCSIGGGFPLKWTEYLGIELITFSDL
jgi:predicted glycoside hydrolase/deacetylase ChbG (UPF0249 family)